MGITKLFLNQTGHEKQGVLEQAECCASVVVGLLLSNEVAWISLHTSILSDAFGWCKCQRELKQSVFSVAVCLHEMDRDSDTSLSFSVWHKEPKQLSEKKKLLYSALFFSDYRAHM